jgi:capsular exopolysaccharide synthesis family protein
MDNLQPRQIQTISRPIGTKPAMALETELSPKDILVILRRHIWLIILLTCISLMGSAAAWFLVRRYAPRYTALTYIRVLPPVETDPTRIGSPIVGKDIQYGRRVYIASLLKEQSMLMNLLGRDSIQTTKWFRSFGSDTNQALRIREAFEDLQKKLGASASRDAEFVTISMTCASADESADIVNEMVDLFIASQRDTAVSGVRNKLVELEKRRNSLEGELALAEKALDEVRLNTGITDLEKHSFQDAITIRLNALDQEEQDLQLNITEFQTAIETLEERAKGPIGVQVENAIEGDPTMMMLTQQLFNSKIALAQAQTKYGESHRIIQEMKERIADIQERRNIRKQEIGEQTQRANLLNAKDQLENLNKRLDEAKRQQKEAEAEKKRFDFARVQYDQRARIRDQVQEQLNEIKDLIEQRRIQAEDPETPKVMSVGKAPKPLKMSSPLWYVYFPGGTMIGFVSAIGLAFLLELLNDLLRTPRDVIKYVRIPLLGVVPNALEDHELEGTNLCHIVRKAPYSIVSEAYRQLQVNLRLSHNQNSDAKVIFMSSCGAGEGKTTVAINLATTLVDENRKVLLVDANFWRAMLHREFSNGGLDKPVDSKAKSQLGLANLLSGVATAEQVIRPSGLDRLDIIEAGPAPANPAVLLGSESMTKLISEYRRYYDYIIIDGPPILLVSGAKTLAGSADGTILVFNADMTRRGAAQRAVRELRAINAEIIGCVLMGARVLKGGYFHEQYRSYQRYQQPLLAG